MLYAPLEFRDHMEQFEGEATAGRIPRSANITVLLKHPYDVEIQTHGEARIVLVLRRRRGHAGMHGALCVWSPSAERCIARMALTGACFRWPRAHLALLPLVRIFCWNCVIHS